MRYAFFLYPDCTVGSGISPDRHPFGRSRTVTAGGELHPAPKITFSIARFSCLSTVFCEIALIGGDGKRVAALVFGMSLMTVHPAVIHLVYLQKGQKPFPQIDI